MTTRKTNGTANNTPKTKQKVWQGIFILLATIIICLLLLEIVFRIFPCDFSADLCYKTYRTTSDRRHHAFIPNSVGEHKTPEYSTLYFINELGIRDEPFNPAAKYQIIMLGDSFTEGYGVNSSDSVSEQLESLLNAAGIDTQVWNAGIGSYSPLLEALFVQELVPIIKPDIVILNLDMSDFQDDYLYEKNLIIKDGMASVKSAPKGIKNLNFHLKRLSYVYTLFVTLIFEGFQPDNKAVIDSNDLSIDNDRWIMSRFNISETKLSPQYNRTFKYIKGIAEYCNRQNISFVLVTYPYGHQVNGNEWKEGRTYFNFDKYTVYNLEYFDRTGQFAARNNISYINSQSAFANSTENNLFYSRDIHMTPAGYRLLANTIFRGLPDVWN